MTEKRFHYDWKTGRFKDTQSNSCATSNMRVLETQINNACFNYEKKIKKLEKENKELKDFKEKVFDLIDENIKYYRKYSTLTVKMPMDCKYRKSCLDNHSINVGNKAKENAYQKLKKELSE